VKKIGTFGFVMAAVVVAGIAASNPASAVTYTVSGTGINQPAPGVSFSFTLTLPNFINSVQENVPLDSCTVGSADFNCSVAHFRPAQDFGIFGQYDQIDFVYENSDNSGGGGAQLLFQLGALQTPGVYLVGPISFSADAILTVTADAVPVPAALPLFLTGLGVIGFLARRKRKADAVV